ncbi:MAG: hypothetical protein K9M75_09290 [Phycisphaerae bacterium]|nr:hypothetical protein [Phycisphaerae bacterium]
MLSSQQKRTIIVCISLLAMTLSTAIFAETIGQKIMRLKREKEQGKQSNYDRSQLQINETKKPAAEPEKPVSEAVNAVSNPNDPLSLVPADALFCVRINSFGESLSMLDQFLLGVSPMPLTSMVNGQIATIIGNKMLTGINFDGNVIIFGKLNPKSGKPENVILLPITSYEDFTGGHPNCSKPDEDGFSTIKPANLLTSKAADGKYTYLAESKNKAMLMEIIKSTNKSLTTSLTANEQQRANNSPLWVYGNIEYAIKAYKPMLGLALQSALKKGNAAQTEMLIDTLDQFKSASLTLTPTDQKLALSLSLSAKPGTELANTLMADPTAKSGFQLAGYLKDESAMNFVAKFNKPLITKIATPILDNLPTDSTPHIAELIKLTHDTIDALGSEMAYSTAKGSGDNATNSKLIIKARNNKSTEKIAQLQLGMAQIMSKTQTAEAMQIKNTEYGRIMIISQNIPAPANNPAPSALPKMHVAAANDMVVTCVGSMDDMKALVHNVQARAPRPSGDMAKALEMVENSDEMDFVVSLNLLRMASMASKAAGAAPMPQAKMLGGMLSGIKGQSKSCMALAGKVDDGRVDVSVILPKDHLQEVMGAFMMQMMQSGQKGSGSMKMEISE